MVEELLEYLENAISDNEKYIKYFNDLPDEFIEGLGNHEFSLRLDFANSMYREMIDLLNTKEE